MSKVEGAWHVVSEISEDLRAKSAHSHRKFQGKALLPTFPRESEHKLVDLFKGAPILILRSQRAKSTF